MLEVLLCLTIWGYTRSGKTIRRFFVQYVVLFSIVSSHDHGMFLCTPVSHHDHSPSVVGLSHLSMAYFVLSQDVYG